MLQRAACWWATPCGRGCSTGANYQSPTVHLPPALATGRLDIVCDAMVRETVLGANGKAEGVRFIDRTSGDEYTATALVVVLAASAYENARIMINSKSTSYPQVLANTGGKVRRL